MYIVVKLRHCAFLLYHLGDGELAPTVVHIEREKIKRCIAQKGSGQNRQHGTIHNHSPKLFHVSTVDK